MLHGPLGSAHPNFLPYDFFFLFLFLFLLLLHLLALRYFITHLPLSFPLSLPLHLATPASLFTRIFCPLSFSHPSLCPSNTSFNLSVLFTRQERLHISSLSAFPGYLKIERSRSFSSTLIQSLAPRNILIYFPSFTMQPSICRLVALVSLTLQCANALPGLPPAAIASNKPAAEVQAASVDNGGLNTEGVATLDGIALTEIREGRSAVDLQSQSIAQTGWTATADSWQPGNEPANAIDGSYDTMWHSPWGADGAPLPHYITVNMQQVYRINSVAYTPRQDGQDNGNIGEHQIEVSTDGNNFNQIIAIGTWQDSNSTKTVLFSPVNAQYVRIVALTEAGDRGPWSSMAELNVFETNEDFAPPGEGEWSPTIDFPLVPVSMAIEHDTGNVLVWSSYAASTFGGSTGGNTLTATFNPQNMIVSQRNVYETDHDMFCEGLSMDSTGRIIATGGNNAPKTSMYSPKYDAWTTQAQMNIPRGYQSSATLSNGNVFTIGGSWSGGTGGKNGEVYSPFDDVWSLLPNAPVDPMLTGDAQGVYRADNHGWLFGWKDGYVFQAGPSVAMHWYGTDLANGGSVEDGGPRTGDTDAMCGDAVMYDAVAGKILALGGAVDYQGIDATANAFIITIQDHTTPANVQQINPMWYQRIFANGVVLPNGHVFVTGGQVYGQPFSDDTAQLTPEMWDPVTTTFRQLAPMAIPRTYHSTALLMADARIISGGGGLCGACATNHYDAQVYTPDYLLNPDGSLATRPVIEQSTYQVNVGGTITATTDSLVTDWSMLRLGSTTHTVNTDQRRVPLTATAAGNTYTMQVPGDPGVLLPGYYMLFAINAAGVPSVANFVWVPAP